MHGRIAYRSHAFIRSAATSAKEVVRSSAMFCRRDYLKDCGCGWTVMKFWKDLDSETRAINKI